MDEQILLTPAPRTAAESRAVIAQLFVEMNRLNEQMRKDQADIDRLKIETDALKAETQRLKAETRAMLAKMGAAV